MAAALWVRLERRECWLASLELDDAEPDSLSEPDVEAPLLLLSLLDSLSESEWVAWAGEGTNRRFGISRKYNENTENAVEI